MNTHSLPRRVARQASGLVLQPQGRPDAVVIQDGPEPFDAHVRELPAGPERERVVGAVGRRVSPVRRIPDEDRSFDPGLRRQPARVDRVGEHAAAGLVSRPGNAGSGAVVGRQRVDRTRATTGARADPSHAPWTPPPDAGSARRSARNVSWVLVVVGVFLFLDLVNDGAGAFVFFVVVALGVGLVAVPLQRRSQRSAAADSAAAGALWGGRVVAQPPNLGVGQSGRSLFAGFTPSYWRTVAAGHTARLPGRSRVRTPQAGPDSAGLSAHAE